MEKYLYEVLESKSPYMIVGEKFWADRKLHDNRKKDKTVELSDVECRDYTLKFIKKKEWESFRRKRK